MFIWITILSIVGAMGCLGAAIYVTNRNELNPKRVSGKRRSRSSGSKRNRETDFFQLPDYEALADLTKSAIDEPGGLAEPVPVPNLYQRPRIGDLPALGQAAALASSGPLAREVTTQNLEIYHAHGFSRDLRHRTHWQLGLPAQMCQVMDLLKSNRVYDLGELRHDAERFGARYCGGLLAEVDFGVGEDKHDPDLSLLPD